MHDGYKWIDLGEIYRWDWKVGNQRLIVRPSHADVCSSPRRPSLSQSTDTDGGNQGARTGLLPKLAISAESEGEETSGLGDPSKTSLSIGELPQDEHDATTPGSTHSGATLSGSEAPPSIGLLLLHRWTGSNSFSSLSLSSDFHPPIQSV